MRSWLNKFLLLPVLLLLTMHTAEAQCAMCRATLENNLANGDLTVGSTINIGIMYLFLAPYVAVALIGYLWYRSSRKKASA